MNVVCKASRRMMSAQLDGQLSWWRLVFLRLHVSQCPSCTTVHASLNETVGLLRGLDEPSEEPAKPRRV